MNNHCICHEGGQRLCFHSFLSVCLSVCEQDISKCCGWIQTKFGRHADLAYQWGTKCELFSLVEVCAPLSAIVVFLVDDITITFRNLPVLIIYGMYGPYEVCFRAVGRSFGACMGSEMPPPSMSLGLMELVSLVRQLI